MIKNIVFDIGNVILKFKVTEVLKRYTTNEEEQKFILENIIHSPEWLQFGLLDTGYVSREEAIKLVQDRTNHTNDEIIEDFWNTYNDYAEVDVRMLEVIKKLKGQNYNIYLLSNLNPYTHEFISKTELLEIVDGYILSYQVHMIKPYIGIYNTLLNRFSLIPEETLFIDDNQNNIDTGNRLGIISRKVEPDNFESVKSILEDMKLI